MVAWIEIWHFCAYSAALSGRYLHGGVDWNSICNFGEAYLLHRYLHGGVDWNLQAFLINIVHFCRYLHGGVDWNIKWLSSLPPAGCRYLHGGVDWNRLHQRDLLMPWRRYLHGGVDWNFLRSLKDAFAITSLSSWWRGLKSFQKREKESLKSRYLHGGVDWNRQKAVEYGMEAVAIFTIVRIEAFLTNYRKQKHEALSVSLDQFIVGDKNPK